MIIEIHQPELEAWLRQRDVEELLMRVMRSAAFEPNAAQPVKQNLADFLLQSPLAGSGIEIERIKDCPRPLDLGPATSSIPNVISEVVKSGPNLQVISWLRQADPLALYASVITFGEIRLGVENARIGRRRAELEAWLETGLPGGFARNLLPVTKDIADQWDRVAIKAKRQGVQLPINDGLIAGTALVHDLTLVTRNVKDFAGLGLTLLNPWDTP